MIKRNALGRGLDSLIRTDEVRTDGSSAISEIPISQIEANPDQPRRTFDEDSLDELATSIRELGIVQPLTLRSVAPNRYQIIAGERRWRAAMRAGLNSVPAYVRTATDSEVTEMALIENIQREDLNAIEVALGFKKLIDTLGFTQESLGERLGKKRSTIANHLRLLRLPAEIQIGLRDRKIDMGHARAILALQDSRDMLRLYKKILKDSLSVREVEALAKKINAERENPDEEKPQKPAKTDNSRYAEFADSLSRRFSAPVKFKRSPNGKGTITFNFSSDDDLHRLIMALEGNN
jgi:ParB family chromosome partitioning protein